MKLNIGSRFGYCTLVLLSIVAGILFGCFCAWLGSHGSWVIPEDWPK